MGGRDGASRGSSYETAVCLCSVIVQTPPTFRSRTIVRLTPSESNATRYCERQPVCVVQAADAAESTTTSATARPRMLTSTQSVATGGGGDIEPAVPSEWLHGPPSRSLAAQPAGPAPRAGPLLRAVLRVRWLATMVRFRVVVPVRNAQRWVGRCVASIRAQQGVDLRCVVLDDRSDDATYARAVEAAAGDPRVSVVQAPERRFALANLADGIRRIATDPWDVVATVDGDDWLRHRRALALVARRYDEHDAWLTYGSYQRWRGGLLDRLRLRAVRGITRRFPDDVLARRSFRAQPWQASHLRTFRRFLWDAIRPEDLRDERGEWLRVTWDVALMLPMLEMAGKDHLVHVREMVYVYNETNPASDHRLAAEEQLLVECRLRLKAPYPLLTSPPARPDGATPRPGPS